MKTAAALSSLIATLVLAQASSAAAFTTNGSWTSSPPVVKTSQLSMADADTPETLPTFENAEEYIDYLKTVAALPKGFATGTGEGTFVSVEAPSLGDLKIRGTVIQLTDGPSDNWAATYTSNKVSS